MAPGSSLPSAAAFAIGVRSGRPRHPAAGIASTVTLEDRSDVVVAVRAIESGNLGTAPLPLDPSRIARLNGIGLPPEKLAEDHAYTRTHPGFRAKLKEKDAFFLQFSIDMPEFGIRRPADGPATGISLPGRVPVMDQGTATAIRDGRIRIIDAGKNPIVRITERGAAFRDGEEEFDAIILATGMEPGLDELFEDQHRHLYWNADMQRRMRDTDGRCRSATEPSLYFPVFDLSANGGLSLGLWGPEVADKIAGDRRA